MHIIEDGHAKCDFRLIDAQRGASTNPNPDDMCGRCLKAARLIKCKRCGQTGKVLSRGGYCQSCAGDMAVKQKPKCTRCGLQAEALSVDGYCMACFGEIMREKNPGMNIHFAGDMADLANKQQGA